MALDQSALLEVLDALKVADVGDRIREAAETIYQGLIEAELTDAIGAAPHERSAERTAQRTATGLEPLVKALGTLAGRLPRWTVAEDSVTDG
jgi:putative transposase